mmetsp:Transcript_38703/g.109737  ORF Transcript_38703/g.109737 Transcript_38703/m.109737 type:complete len:101 (+) Transcript_38703:190-492(+)
MHVELASMATMFGASTIGSESIHPHMHHTTALKKLATTSGPGTDRLFLVLRTVGTVTSIDIAPKKLHSDATSPVKKRARSGGSAARADACRSTSAATPVR